MSAAERGDGRVDRLGVITRTECGRCGAEVRAGKKMHFCGGDWPPRATADIRVVEYVPRSELTGAVTRAAIAEDHIAEAEHVLRACGIADKPPRPLSQRIRELAARGGQ